MVKVELGKSSCYCINFRRAANTLTKFYDQAFAPLDITVNQFSLLVNIDRLQACNKSELAHYTGIDRTTIIRNLDVLLRKELIREVPGKTRRNKLIQLSEKGQQAILEGVEIWKKLQDKVKGVLGEEKKEVLWSIFGSIAALDGEMES